MKKYLVWIMTCLVLFVPSASLLTSCRMGEVVEPRVSVNQPAEPNHGGDSRDSVGPGVHKPGVAPEWATQYDRDKWRSYSQAERNMLILYKAYGYNGQYGYCNCKEWVRKIVLEASNGVVNIPATLPDASGWYFGSSPYLIGMSGGIRGAGQGTLVQLNWRFNDGSTSPHTMIVSGRTTDGVSVIEANWISCRVTTRWISFSEFDRHVVRYSTYIVTGG